MSTSPIHSSSRSSSPPPLVGSKDEIDYEQLLDSALEGIDFGDEQETPSSMNHNPSSPEIELVKRQNEQISLQSEEMIREKRKQLITVLPQIINVTVDMYKSDPIETRQLVKQLTKSLMSSGMQQALAKGQQSDTILLPLPGEQYESKLVKVFTNRLSSEEANYIQNFLLITSKDESNNSLNIHSYKNFINMLLEQKKAEYLFPQDDSSISEKEITERSEFLQNLQIKEDQLQVMIKHPEFDIERLIGFIDVLSKNEDIIPLFLKNTDFLMNALDPKSKSKNVSTQIQQILSKERFESMRMSYTSYLLEHLGKKG